MNGITEFPFCLVGESELNARKLCVDNDFVFRCVERNGNKVATTRDIRVDRINVVVENDIITRAYIG